MNDENNTYRYSEKVELEKSTDEIVVNTLPNILVDAAIECVKKSASVSTKN